MGRVCTEPVCRKPGTTVPPLLTREFSTALAEPEVWGYVMLGSPKRAQLGYRGHFLHEVCLPRNGQALPVPGVVMGGLLETYESR